MKKLLGAFLLMFIGSIQSSVYGQLPDSVVATSSYLKEIIKNYKEENAMTFDLNSISTSSNIPLRVHIIRNNKGLDGVSGADIKGSVALANTYFKVIGLQFYIDSMNVINDYNYGYIQASSNTKELLTGNVVPGKINLFLVDSIKMTASRSYGFTYFPVATDSNYIFLNKNYISGTGLTTMLGHFMGLLSTHEAGGGAELVSEKNCDVSGDFICDTYADPNMFNQVVDTCKYTGAMKDANGKFFVPSVTNIMSDSPASCKCVFTFLQYRRMYYYYRKYRQGLK